MNNLENTKEYTLIEHDKNVDMYLDLSEPSVGISWRKSLIIGEYFSKIIDIGEGVSLHNNTQTNKVIQDVTFDLEYSENGKYIINKLNADVRTSPDGNKNELLFVVHPSGKPVVYKNCKLYLRLTFDKVGN